MEEQLKELMTSVLQKQKTKTTWKWNKQNWATKIIKKEQKRKMKNKNNLREGNYYDCQRSRNIETPRKGRKREKKWSKGNDTLKKNCTKRWKLFNIGKSRKKWKRFWNKVEFNKIYNIKAPSIDRLIQKSYSSHIDNNTTQLGMKA